jgi:hypothetical protein
MKSKKLDPKGWSWRFLICGVIGAFGSFLVVITDIIGAIVVDGYNPISQTISSLAITEKAWIQDVGLNCFAASFAACAIGLYYLRLEGWKWKSGTFMLMLLAVDILVISEYDRYADQDSFGATVHLFCVIVLGILFTLAPIALATGFRRISYHLYRYSLGTAVAWAITSPIFFFIPNSWDGAYERFIALIMVAWISMISRVLFRYGTGQRLSNFRG